MTLSRAKPAGWALNEIFTSAQANHMDTEIVKALDGAGGGSYAPTTVLRVAGEGFGVSSLFDSEGFSPIFGLQNWSYGVLDGLTAGAEARGFTYSATHRVWMLAGSTDAADISYDDGLTWVDDSGSMASTVALEDIANSRGNDRWVAVGNSATAYTRSGIGGAWSTSTLPASPTLVHGVFYDPSNDLFIAIGREVGPTPYLATSPGTGVPSWTDRSATVTALTNFGTEDLKSGVSNESGVSVVAASAASRTKVIFSTNGTSWAESTTSLVADQYTVGYNPGVDKFMAYGITFDNVYTSSDGDTWTLVSTMVEFDSPALEQHRIVGSLGRLWIIGGEINNVAAIAYSEDDFVNPSGWRVQLVGADANGLLSMGFGEDGIHGKVLAGVDAATSTIYGSLRGSAM